MRASPALETKRKNNFSFLLSAPSRYKSTEFQFKRQLWGDIIVQKTGIINVPVKDDLQAD